MRCKGDGSCPNAMTHAARTREASRKAAGADGVRDGTVEAARILRPPSTDVRSQTCATTSRSEEHTSELQSLMRNSYAVFCLKKKITTTTKQTHSTHTRE